MSHRDILRKISYPERCLPAVMMAWLVVFSGRKYNFYVYFMFAEVSSQLCQDTWLSKRLKWDPSGWRTSSLPTLHWSFPILLPCLSSKELLGHQTYFMIQREGNNLRVSGWYPSESVWLLVLEVTHLFFLSKRVLKLKSVMPSYYIYSAWGLKKRNLSPNCCYIHSRPEAVNNKDGRSAYYQCPWELKRIKLANVFVSPVHSLKCTLVI